MDIFKNKENYFKLTNKKRRRSSFSKEEIAEIECKTNKCNSAESKKINKLNNNDEINYFMAKLDDKYKNINFTEEEKLSGKSLIFAYRRKQAKKIINNLKEDNDELKKILEALQYDNTNKTCIYKLLKYYNKHQDRTNYDDSLNKYKFCITQKFKIQENGEKIFVDLNKLYKVTLAIEELEELPNCKRNEVGSVIDLRNSLVEFFTSYYYIAKCLSKFKNTLNSEKLKRILSV